MAVRTAQSSLVNCGYFNRRWLHVLAGAATAVVCCSAPVAAAEPDSGTTVMVRSEVCLRAAVQLPVVGIGIGIELGLALPRACSPMELPSPSPPPAPSPSPSPSRRPLTPSLPPPRPHPLHMRVPISSAPAHSPGPIAKVAPPPRPAASRRVAAYAGPPQHPAPRPLSPVTLTLLITAPAVLAAAVLRPRRK